MSTITATFERWAHGWELTVEGEEEVSTQAATLSGARQQVRDYLDTKLSKVPQLDPRVQRIEVMVSHEPNPRQAKVSERVEITCRSKGPVIRAEACHDEALAWAAKCPGAIGGRVEVRPLLEI